MKYLIIFLLFIGCTSEFDFPDECEQHNLDLERQRRIMYQDAAARCESTTCSVEEFEEMIHKINEHIDEQLCTE